MKRHHLTTLAAIAIVLVGVFVVIQRLNAPEEQSHSPEHLQALNQRQAERFRESKRARESAAADRPKTFSALIENLLEEFPALRGEAAIPNEDNPIYLLSELIKKHESLLDRSAYNLVLIKTSTEEVPLERLQHFIKQHEPILEELETIAEMRAGSFYFEEGDMFSGGAASLRALLDLLQLKSDIGLKTHGAQSRPWRDPLFTRTKLSRIIQGSEGVSMAHILMFRGNSSDPSKAKELYDNLSSMNIYSPLVMFTWHSPYWGKNLSAETLIREARREWHTPNPFDEPIHADPVAMRAYAQYANDTVIRLQEQGLATYLRSPTAEVPSDGLSQTQVELVKSAVMTLEQHLNMVVSIGLHQHQEWEAFDLRNIESEGAEISNRLIPEPLSGSNYDFDPETRLLSRSVQFEGYELAPTRVHRPEEGGVWNTVPMPFGIESPDTK